MRTHCLLVSFTLTALFSAGSTFGADPRLMNLVMPDATSVAGVNVTNAKNSPFGQYVLTGLTSSMSQQMQAFVTATGFDPRQDVTEIVAASSATAANPSGLVLALGNFPVAQMTSAITAKSAQLTVQTYGGATLITGGDAKSSFSVAFLGTTISAAGDTASVKAAIDRSMGVNSINPALATQVQALSTTNDAWAVTTSSASALLAGLDVGIGTGGPGSTGGAAPAGPMGQFGQMFNSIQGSSGGIQFGTTVNITGQAITTDAASAKSLADVMTALVSIASMAGTGATGPAGGQNQQFAAIAQLLQGLKVTASGATINLALSVPEATLESFVNSMKAQTAKPAGAVPASRPANVPKASVTPSAGSSSAVAAK